MSNKSATPQIQPRAENLFLHDLSTPLSILLGHLEMLEATLAATTDEATVKRLKGLRSSLDKIVTMVQSRKVELKQAQMAIKPNA